MWTARAINILNRLKYQTLSSTLLLGLSFNGMVFGADKNGTDLLHTYSVPHMLSISHQKINPVILHAIGKRESSKLLSIAKNCRQHT